MNTPSVFVSVVCCAVVLFAQQALAQRSGLMGPAATDDSPSIETQTSQPSWIYFQQKTFTVYEEVTEFMEVTGNPGYGFPHNDVAFTGLGGVLLINNILHNADPTQEAAETEIVGTSRNVCTRVSAMPKGENPKDARKDVTRIARCELTIELPQGSILASGVFYENAFEAFEPQRFAITGGTGRYTGSNGQVTLTQLIYPGVVVQLDVSVNEVWESTSP